MRSLYTLVSPAAPLLFALGLAACGDGAVHPCDRVLGPIDPAGIHHGYVIDSIYVPTEREEIREHGLNLDDNPHGLTRNALAYVISVAMTDRVDVNADAAARLARGELIHLIDVQALALDRAPDVGVRILRGTDEGRAPDGSPSFMADDASRSEPLTGTIRHGSLIADLGVMPLEFFLPHLEETFELTLVGARIEAEIDAGFLRGRLGGGVTTDEVDRVLLPAVQRAIAAMIARDCPDGVCEPDSTGQLYLDLFDEEGDGAVSLENLRDSALVKSLVLPDVDLLDADGALRPGCDGVRDSLSFAVDFTAVPAGFDLPAGAR